MQTRLVSGDGTKGIVQVYSTKESQWQHLCGDYTTPLKTARVVCRSLGFNDGDYDNTVTSTIPSGNY